MSSIIQLLITGLAMGCIYVLIGISFVLIYNAVGVVNFSQSEFVMFGGYFSVLFIGSAKMHPILGLVLSCVAMGLVGVVFERFSYRPLRKQSWLLVMISTVGVSMMLKDLARVIWGAQPQRIPPLFTVFSVDVLGIKINPQYLLIFGVTAVLLFIQWYIFDRTMTGKKLTATAQDAQMAQLMGIHTTRMVVLTFVYSLVLAAIAGFLLTPLFYATNDMASMSTLKAFVAAIIGGFGSIPGVVLGGLFVGIIETFAASFISSAMKDAVAFLVLIIFLIFRPQGIFGEKFSKRV